MLIWISDAKSQLTLSDDVPIPRPAFLDLKSTILMQSEKDAPGSAPNQPRKLPVLLSKSEFISRGEDL